MIGFDRPLRPIWIHKTLGMLVPDTSASTYYDPFEHTVKELTGKEGKKKVRVIVFRSFIYSMQHSKSIIEDTLFLHWRRNHDLLFMQPLYLAKLLMDYEVCRFAASKLYSGVDASGHINSRHFRNKFIEEFGDRNVVRKSLRSFFTTLEHFGLLEKLTVNDMVLTKRFSLTVEQTRCFLILYSQSYLKSKMVDIKHLDQNVLFFYPAIPLQKTAHKYNGKDWEYIREPSRELLLLK